MAPFFSYNRFSSIGDELIGLLPGKVSAAVAAIAPSDESTEPRDRPADDQVLHLVGALVGVEGLGIGKEAGSVVVGDDAVAAEQLAPPGDRLAHPARAECLRERCVLVSQLAVVVQLRQPRHQALAGGDVAEHLGQQVLNQLERRDRLAELQAILGVFEGGLVSAHLAARRRPADHVAGHAQNARSIAKGIATLQPDRKSTRLNSSHDQISYAVFCLKKKKKNLPYLLFKKKKKPKKTQN